MNLKEIVSSKLFKIATTLVLYLSTRGAQMLKISGLFILYQNFAGSSEFGLLSQAIGLAFPLSFLLSFSSQSVLLRFSAQKEFSAEEYHTTALLFTLSVSFLLIVIVWLFPVIGVAIFGVPDPSLLPYYTIISAVTIAQLSMISARLRVEERDRLAVTFQLSQHAIQFLSLGGAWILINELNSVMLFAVSIDIFFILYISRFTRLASTNLSCFRNKFGYAASGTFNFAGVNVFTFLARIAVANVSSAAELGEFNLFLVLSAGIQIIGQAINFYFLPRLAKLADNDNVGRAKKLNLISMIAFIASSLIISCIFILLYYVYGSNFEHIVPIVILLLCAKSILSGTEIFVRNLGHIQINLRYLNTNAMAGILIAIAFFLFYSPIDIFEVAFVLTLASAFKLVASVALNLAFRSSIK